MEVKHINDNPKGYFYIDHEDKPAAKMTYVHSMPGVIIIDHTEVSPVLKGQGAGKLMLETAVEYARNEHLKIIPLCPFAKAMIDKTAEYQDILK